MSFSKSWIPREIEYKPHALRDLRRLGPKEGERVRRAFKLLAETGRGDVKPVEPREVGFLELRVGLYLRGYFRYADGKIIVYGIGQK